MRRFVEFLGPSAIFYDVDVSLVATLPHEDVAGSLSVGVKVSSLDSPHLGEIGGAVKVLTHVEAMVVWNVVAAVLHEVSTFWHQVESHVLLGAVDGLQVVVVVVCLANDGLLGETFYEMIGTIGDLLVLEGELRVFAVSIHFTKALFKCIDGLSMDLITVFNLIFCWLLPIL